MKRILVTGATGFLGTIVIKKLMARPDVRLVASCRDRSRLPSDFNGEVREGDLEDSSYRKTVVRNVDAIAHTASWASMWRYSNEEKRKFYLPTISLIEEAIHAGVERFVLTGSIAMNRKASPGTVYRDDDPTADTGYWPHLDYLNGVDRFMRENAHRGTSMVTLRLGHFIGPGNRLGLVPALVPRLKTGLVPHLSGGNRKMPVITPGDLGDAFEGALLSYGLNSYESFHIVGKEFPSLRDILSFISGYTGISMPRISVPYNIAYFFGFLMELLHPPLPGGPFLTRSIVHLAEGWVASSENAKRKLGYDPGGDWREALREHLNELKCQGYPWPALKSKS